MTLRPSERNKTISLVYAMHAKGHDGIPHVLFDWIKFWHKVYPQVGGGCVARDYANTGGIFNYEVYLTLGATRRNSEPPNVEFCPIVDKDCKNSNF